MPLNIQVLAFALLCVGGVAGAIWLFIGPWFRRRWRAEVELEREQRERQRQVQQARTRAQAEVEAALKPLEMRAQDTGEDAHGDATPFQH